MRDDRMAPLKAAQAPQRTTDSFFSSAPLTCTGVLIVGGGPAGYATAAALAQQGFKDITILERSSSPGYFDPQKQFVFNISAAGKEVLSSFGFPPIDGLPSTGMDVKYLHPSGKVESKSVNMGPRNKDNPSTWIPRSSLNEQLYNHVTSAYSDSVKVVMSARVTDVSIPSGTSPAVVTASVARPDGTAETVRYTSRLIVGADGASSTVRNALQAAQPGAGWEMKKYPSDSGGLAWKVLPLPPNPKLSEAVGVLSNEQSIIIPGQPVDGAFPIKLGLLNIKDSDQQRTANVILWPDHPFWKIDSTEDWYAYLERAFPQLDRLREAIPVEQAQAFLDAPLSTFKDPQACSRTLAELPAAEPAAVNQDDRAAEIEGCAVCLVGDAAHFFPPDIGQGVNSAFFDVAALHQSFKDHPESASAALQAYDANRRPEHQALVRIQQFAFPYQYRQAGMKVQRFLWTLNFLFRTLLHKVAPALFSAHVVANITSAGLHGTWATMYQDALKKADRTTRNIFLVMAAVAAAVAAYALMGRV